MSFLIHFLEWFKSIFFLEPRIVPFQEENHEEQLKQLIDLINHERSINGLLPLDEIHELNVVASDSAKFNYQYYDFTNKPQGMAIQFRLMKMEYPVAASAEIIINSALSAEDAFNQMKLDITTRELIRNGYFCHIGTGKCGNFWTAVFAQPRY